MKLTVMFKTPDALDYAIADLNEDEQEEAKRVAEKFIRYGEYVTIIIDTDNETATVREL